MRIVVTVETTPIITDNSNITMYSLTAIKILSSFLEITYITIFNHFKQIHPTYDLTYLQCALVDTSPLKHHQLLVNMADPEAADGWSDMDFDDDNLDVDQDIVEPVETKIVPEVAELLPLPKLEVSAKEDQEIKKQKEQKEQEEQEEQKENIEELEERENLDEQDIKDEEQGENVEVEEIPKVVTAVEHEKQIDLVSEPVDAERIEQSEQLPVPKQNGHREEEENDAVAELRAQLNALQLQIEQKDEELHTLKSRPQPVQENSDNDAVTNLRHKLEDAEAERDDAKQQLEDFLSKISSMKSVVRNYKAAQEELVEVREQLTQAISEKEEADEELAAVKEKSQGKDAEIKKLTDTIVQFKTESSDLNNECDRLSQQLTLLRREYQSKDDSFQDEKYSLENEVSRLAKKISEHKTEYSELELAKEEIAMENKNLTLIIEELKGKIDSKDAEVSQYSLMVEDITAQSEKSIEELNVQVESQKAENAKLVEQLERAQVEAKKLTQSIEQNTEEISRLQEETLKIAELKEEVHSKQLIIGKLRHEAIILNEHLTKSLSMLKQQLSNTDNTVDRELISNVFLNFLQIPRGDSKKFEALLLISALLDWDEPRKVQAGLSHSFPKGKDDEGRPLRQSFVSLWTDFLEKESSNKTAK